MQEVLIAVHSRRGHRDPHRPLRPWLNAITRYKIIDACRRLRREGRGRIELTDEEWANIFAAEEVDPDRSNGDIERLIGSLSQREQAAVRIMGIDGASAREAAERLGSTEGAVRVAFHRSLKRLTAMAKDKF